MGYEGRIGLVGALAGVFVLAGAAVARADAPAAAAGPVRVPIGIHVTALRNVDARAMTFQADFYLWQRFEAESWKEYEARSALEILNATTDLTEEPADTRPTQDDFKAGPQYRCTRYRGTFCFDPKLQNYPFDRQFLTISLENPDQESDRLVFEQDPTSYAAVSGWEGRLGVQPHIEMPEFTLCCTRQTTAEVTYPTDFGFPEFKQQGKRSATYSRFTLHIELRRDSAPYFYKIIIPILVILGMAYLVFWMPAEEFSTACGLAITAILAIIASNVSVAQSLPNVGYLVISDRFFLATYVLLSVSMGGLILLYFHEKAGKTEVVRRWRRIWQVAFPLLSFATLGYLLAHAVLTR